MIALAARAESDTRARSITKDHAGHPPPSSTSSLSTAAQAAKKGNSVALTQQDVFHFICLGIIEQACYRNAFQKENDIPHINLSPSKAYNNALTSKSERITPGLKSILNPNFGQHNSPPVKFPEQAIAVHPSLISKGSLCGTT